MPMTCCIQDCSSNKFNAVSAGIKLYSFPKIWKRTPALESLSKDRRRQWLAAINRKRVNTEIARVCSRHFISGKKAKLVDTLNPDWVPTLHLGYKSKQNPELVAARFERHLTRDANKVLREIQNVECTHQIEATQTEEVPLTTEDEVFLEEVSLEEEIYPEDEYLEEYLDEISLEKEPSHKSIGTQTDLSMQDIDELRSAVQKTDLLIAKKDLEILNQKQEIEKSKMGIEFFEGSDDKTRYFTGLSHYLTLITIYKAIEENVPNCFRKSLNKFQVFILTLMKLRLDLPFTLLGYMFGICKSTASKKFYDCVLVLSAELSTFVSWPDRDVRLYYTPEYFKRLFGDKLAVIIDCYEIRIEKSGQPVARAATYSSYKSTETVKYMIGIAPSGAVIYTSKGYGGRSSDKFIAENSDFLNFLKPQDIVLSDRGFLIHEAVRCRGAELKTPAFMEGRIQLDPFAVEDSKNLAHLRIHIERVIGTLRQKYLILSNTQPLTAISKKTDDNVMCMDAIVCTCCALLNLSPSVVTHTLITPDSS